MVTTRERPIIFSGPMVRATLDDRKTQTRRIVKPQPQHPRFRGMLALDDEGIELYLHDRTLVRAVRCPYGKPGDRLWVRETWGDCSPGADALVGTKWDKPWYRADADTYGLLGHDGEGAVYVEDVKWRPSIHMPRSASRITLEVTAVRIERLQDISEADAVSEGIGQYDNGTFGLNNPGACMGPTAKVAYMRLWEFLHGPGFWDANPLVWVIEFKRIT